MTSLPWEAGPEFKMKWAVFIGSVDKSSVSICYKNALVKQDSVLYDHT